MPDDSYKLRYSDYPGTDTGPPDPERWVGPPGPPGPPGPGGGGGGGSASIEVTDVPPTPTDGGLWFDTTSAQLYVGYDDGSSVAWIIATNAGTGSGGGSGGGGGGDYVLPPATTTTLGGVMVDGSTIIVDGSGVISSTTSGGGAVGLVDTVGPGITGGPITTTGTLSVQWNAGPVSVVGTGLTVTSGVLTATATPYTLPPASTTTLGGVKVDGASIVIDGSGVISATTGGTGSVSNVATSGPGITGGPITTSGTLAVQWNAGPANTISTGLLLSGGVLSSTALLSFNSRPGPAITLTSADVTSALSYVPYDGASNPNGYQTAVQLATALVPYATLAAPAFTSTISVAGPATFASTVSLAADPTTDLQASTKKYVDLTMATVAASSVTILSYQASTTSTSSGPPGNGNIRFSSAAQYDSTALYVSTRTTDNTDWYLFLKQMAVGARLVIQLKIDSTKVIRFLIAGTITDNTTWLSIPVTQYGSPGVGLPFTNGQNIVLGIVGIGGDQFLPISGGTLTGPLTVTSGIVGTPYVLAAYVPGVLAASQVLLLHQVATAFTFPANFGTAISGGTSRFGSLANATGAPALTVWQLPAASDPVSGTYTNIGSLTFSLGGHAGTLATALGTAKPIAAGDFIRITGPASADTTLANVFITLVGNR